MFGYSGRILHIDLSSRKHWVEEKAEDWYKTYIGGCIHGHPIMLGEYQTWL